MYVCVLLIAFQQALENKSRVGEKEKELDNVNKELEQLQKQIQVAADQRMAQKQMQQANQVVDLSLKQSQEQEDKQLAENFTKKQKKCNELRADLEALKAFENIDASVEGPTVNSLCVIPKYESNRLALVVVANTGQRYGMA